MRKLDTWKDLIQHFSDLRGIPQSTINPHLLRRKIRKQKNDFNYYLAQIPDYQDKTKLQIFVLLRRPISCFYYCSGKALPSLVGLSAGNIGFRVFVLIGEKGLIKSLDIISLFEGRLAFSIYRILIKKGMEHLTTTFLKDMSVRSDHTNCSLKICHLGNKIKRNDQHAPSLLKINESPICCG